MAQVLDLLFLKVFILLGAVGLEDAEGGVETLFDGVFHVLEALSLATALDELAEFVVHIFLVQLIEMETNGSNFVLDLLDIGILHEFFEHGHQLQFVETVQFVVVFNQFFLV